RRTSSWAPSKADNAAFALTGTSPRDQIQPLVRNRLSRLLAPTVFLGPAIQPLQRRVDLFELQRLACRVGRIELLVFRVGTKIREVHGRRGQLAGLVA